MLQKAIIDIDNDVCENLAIRKKENSKNKKTKHVLEGVSATRKEEIHNGLVVISRRRRRNGSGTVLVCNRLDRSCAMEFGGR